MKDPYTIEGIQRGITGSLDFRFGGNSKGSIQPGSSTICSRIPPPTTKETFPFVGIILYHVSGFLRIYEVSFFGFVGEVHPWELAKPLGSMYLYSIYLGPKATI